MLRWTPAGPLRSITSIGTTTTYIESVDPGALMRECAEGVGEAAEGAGEAAEALPKTLLNA